MRNENTSATNNSKFEPPRHESPPISMATRPLSFPHDDLHIQTSASPRLQLRDLGLHSARTTPQNTNVRVGRASSPLRGNTRARNTVTMEQERLRMLVTRNKELQQRLLAETNAAHQLEDEISSITSSYQHFLHLK